VHKKRIAIVANTTWNIYNFRLNLVRKLLDEDNEVFVIAPVDEYIEYKDKFPHVSHIPLLNLDRSSKKPFKDLRLIFELKKIYKKIKPDLIIHYTHKPNIYGGIAARLLGLKSVAVVTGLGYAFINKGIINRFTKIMYAFVKNFHDKIIFENEDDLEYFEEAGLVEKGKGESVKGCGVDAEVYQPFPNGVVKEKTTFTFIGRLLYDKGIVEFIEAAKVVKKQNKKVEFWVLGELDSDNPSMLKREKLLEWINEGVIVYHGFQNDVRPFIAKSDCIVLPSYREGLPRIILEGMSMAKPVITTDTAGCRQTVIDGENGFLVNVKDSNDLIAKMESFINTTNKKRHDMGFAGRKMVVNQFNSKKISDDLYKILAEV